MTEVHFGIEQTAQEMRVRPVSGGSLLRGLVELFLCNIEPELLQGRAGLLFISYAHWTAS
ncbi:MAG: hypothetical protein ABSE51_22145 [Terracidiphilus sp.]|jgi:hypothetical protein